RWEKHVAKQVTMWRVRHSEKAAGKEPRLPAQWAGLSVAFSRMHGAGGDDVAQALSGLLNWPVYDRELVDFIAQNAHVRSQVVESFDEKKKGEIETWLQTMLSREHLDIDRYGKHLLAVLAAFAEHGQAILIGRGSVFVLKPQQGVRVLIHAPLQWRSHRLAQRRTISPREAQAIVQKVDQERLAFVKKYFNRDPNDPDHYDLMINTAHFSPLQAAQLILAALEQKAGSPYPLSGELDQARGV
ncbi:cytidylate kinase-like family protein, partial [bacterium]|nr:cytidylate kinase-like family protein [bacterium]